MAGTFPPQPFSGWGFTLRWQTPTPREWKQVLVSLDALDLYAQQHVLLEPVLLSVVHTEVGAAECAAGIGSANLLLEHGMLEALEGIDGEAHGLGDAVQGQL